MVRTLALWSSRSGAGGDIRSLSAIVWEWITFACFCLGLSLLRYPECLEMNNHGFDLRVAEFLLESRHTTLKIRYVEGITPIFHYLKEQPIRMVPGVACAVVWRRQVASIISYYHPIGLTLAVRTVTSCTALDKYLLA